jgi:hypothetical protein
MRRTNVPREVKPRSERLTEYVNIPMEEWLKTALQKVAESDGTKPTPFVRGLIKREVARRAKRIEAPAAGSR